MKSLIWPALIIGFAVLGYPQSRSPRDIRINEQYFPPRTFDSKPEMDAFVVDWYSKHLAALREPSLWEMSKSSTQQLYRFLWLRTFHAPIVVRLNINADGTGVLITKITNGKGGYEAGRLVKNKSTKLSKDKTQWFLDRVEELKYWNLQSMEEQDPNVVKLDGAQWVLEAVKNGNYKIVERGSPDEGPIRVLGLMMLLDLAELRLLFEEVY